jgi:hypothetical protein
MFELILEPPKLQASSVTGRTNIPLDSSLLWRCGCGPANALLDWIIRRDAYYINYSAADVWIISLNLLSQRPFGDDPWMTLSFSYPPCRLAHLARR